MYLCLVQVRHQLGETGMDLLETVVDGLAGNPSLTGHICAELHLTVNGIDEIDLFGCELVHCYQELCDAGVFTKGILEGALPTLRNHFQRVVGVFILVGIANRPTQCSSPD